MLRLLRGWRSSRSNWRSSSVGVIATAQLALGRLGSLSGNETDDSSGITSGNGLRRIRMAIVIRTAIRGVIWAIIGTVVGWVFVAIRCRFRVLFRLVGRWNDFDVIRCRVVFYRLLGERRRRRGCRHLLFRFGFFLFLVELSFQCFTGRLLLLLLKLLRLRLIWSTAVLPLSFIEWCSSLDGRYVIIILIRSRGG